MEFEDIDFNELYVQQKQKTTFKSKGVEQWNKKAYSMNERVHKSIYNDGFFNSMNFDNCETVLDVGCGVGNLSLKIAPKVKHLYALDFSPMMLEQVKKNASKNDIFNISTINKSWYDSWEDLENVDIVIASRSMEVKDMQNALEKLNNKANKRVYLSYKVGGSFLDENILKTIKKKTVKKPDYIYLLNILYQMGINASIQFLNSEGRTSMYTDVESFIKSVSWSLGELSAEETHGLENYFEHLSDEDKKQNEFVRWALISWEK